MAIEAISGLRNAPFSSTRFKVVRSVPAARHEKPRRTATDVDHADPGHPARRLAPGRSGPGIRLRPWPRRPHARVTMSSPTARAPPVSLLAGHGYHACMPSDTSPRRAAGGTVPSIHRAVQVLDLLAASVEPMTLTEMARELGLPKSSLLAICTTLTELQMMQRTPDGRYDLGIHLVDLGNAYVSGTDLVKAFTSVSPQVTLLADETLVLSMLDGTQAVFLARRHGIHPVGFSWSQAGARSPANCTATGKAQLSMMPEAEIRRRFTGTLHQRTPYSIGDVEELVRDSKRTRARGYAIDDEESRVGLVCLGCPVLDASGNALGGGAVALDKLD